MKLNIKELSFNSGKFDPKWWQLVIAVLTIIVLAFKNEILDFLRSLIK
jgi:hypothetical protein